VTDHRHWLELAAARPVFQPEPAEAAELDAHLASCEPCSHVVSGLRSDLATLARIEVPPSARLRVRIREAALVGDAGGEGWTLATIVIVGLLAAALLGATLGVGAFLNQSADPISELDANSKPISWTTEVVRLGADSVTIVANGTTFHAVSPDMKVHSDPRGDHWTLEVAWLEAKLEQRLNMYFRTDGTSWWIDEIRVYDGVAPNPDWAKLPPGPYAQTPVGQMFRGDIDIGGIGQGGGPVRLTMRGIVLAVAPEPGLKPMPGGVAPPKDPLDSDGPIVCAVPGKPVVPPPKAQPACPPLPSG
jgi:hypothetical protein